MSMMVSFVLSFFPRDVLDEILNLIESVSEDFLTTLMPTPLQRPYLSHTCTRKNLGDMTCDKALCM